jgi:GH25 family lysozyme M1 (1,4-beta-N-acetylmuramidase)
MRVVGSPKAASRGHLGLLAALVCALLASACVLTGASAAATGRAKGIDVSNWQGTIKWGKVAGAGYRFVFGKATEGTTFVDSTYSTNRTGSEGHGLVFGGYHFARPAGGNQARVTASAVAQADYFLATADPQPGELPPVLDLEATGGLNPSRLLLWTQAWTSEIYARLGVEPFVYSSPNFWSSRLADSTAVAASGVPLWIAHWTSNSQPTVPAQNWNGSGWTFWQWSDCVSVPGIAHCVDGDRMNGVNPSSEAIRAYPTGVPVLSTPPSIVGQPESGEFLAAAPGTWLGGKPLQFSYQWLSCDAAGANCVAIPGATRETYAPVDADVGHSLTVVTTATSSAGSAKATAIPTAAVSPAGTPPTARPKNLAPPTTSGSAQAGQTLTSSVGTWTGAPTKFAYRWRRCDATGASCAAIAKATHSSYTLTPDDIGATLSLVVTATGAGGAASATAATTDVVVAAPLPPASQGSQAVEPGVAGNIVTDDSSAWVTWQPGAVPVGLTVTLGRYAQRLATDGTGVSLTVPGLPSGGFAWPLDLAYTTAQPARTVLGYTTNGRVFTAVPALAGPELPSDATVGSYVDSGGLTHVLTRTPLRLALFREHRWGDPTYTSPAGPSLVQNTQVRVVTRPASHSVFVLARLSAQSQTQLVVRVSRRGGKLLAFLGNGSRIGVRLGHRAYKVAKVELERPRAIPVRIRLNDRVLRPGAYLIRIFATDPWGRHSRVTLHFRYP